MQGYFPNLQDNYFASRNHKITPGLAWPATVLRLPVLKTHFWPLGDKAFSIWSNSCIKWWGNLTSIKENYKCLLFVGERMSYVGAQNTPFRWHISVWRARVWFPASHCFKQTVILVKENILEHIWPGERAQAVWIIPGISYQESCDHPPSTKQTLNPILANVVESVIESWW